MRDGDQVEWGLLCILQCWHSNCHPTLLFLFVFYYSLSRSHYFSHPTSDVCCGAELGANLFIQWAHHYSSVTPLCFHCSKLSIFLCCPLTSVDNIKTCERYIQCGLPPFLFSVSPNVTPGLWQPFSHLLCFDVLCCQSSFSLLLSLLCFIGRTAVKKLLPEHWSLWWLFFYTI